MGVEYIGEGFSYGSKNRLVGSVKITNTKWNASQISIDLTNDTWTITGHGLVDGDKVAITTLAHSIDTTTPNGGIKLATTLFVISATADTFQLSTTSAGTSIDWTGAGDTSSWRLEKLETTSLEVTNLSVKKGNCIFSGGITAKAEPRLNGVRLSNVPGALSNSNESVNYEYVLAIHATDEKLTLTGNYRSYYQTADTSRWMSDSTGEFGWLSHSTDGKVSSIGMVLQGGNGGFLDGTILEVYET